MMNADGQHLPERIPEMIDRWRDAAAVVRMIRADTGRGPTPFLRGPDRLRGWLGPMYVNQARLAAKHK